MSSGLREKVYSYALFYFPETNELGTAHTSIIAEGYGGHVTMALVVNSSRLRPGSHVHFQGI